MKDYSNNLNENANKYLQDEYEADILSGKEIDYKLEYLEAQYIKLQLEEDEYWETYWDDIELEEKEKEFLEGLKK